MSNAEGYWYCKQCAEEVSSTCVTYQELHDSCGHPVQWVELHKNKKGKELARLVLIPFAVYAFTVDWKAALMIFVLCFVDNLLKE